MHNRSYIGACDTVRLAARVALPIIASVSVG